MKGGSLAWFMISFLIVVISGVALLFTNIWYPVIVAGIVAALVVRKGYVISTVSSFVGGVVAVLPLFLMLPVGSIGAIMKEVGAIAGIPPTLLLSLIFLINGGLCLSGALIGTFAVKAFGRREQSDRNSGIKG
ncbi:MAG: hypothetical protein M1290_01025 [Candidatus Thermoplasmatota archaeon]|jgi:hypothetical protein|nr:hypothetical protein [Candidatus Thermoplasmatota archaeon]